MNNKILRRLLVLTIAVFSLTIYGAFAQSTPPTCSGGGTQLMDYEMKADNATYTTAYPFTYERANSYYYAYWTVALPFTFCYDTKQYTSVQQAGNANLMFMPYRPGNGTSYPYYYYDLGYNGGWGYASYNKNYLYAWGGLIYSYSYCTGHVGWKLSGSSPNRVMTFEWASSVFHFNSSNPVDVQIKLYEDGTIVYHYGRVACGYTYYMDNYASQYWYYTPAIVLSGWDGNYSSSTNMGSDYINMYPPNSPAGNSEWVGNYVDENRTSKKGPTLYGNTPTFRSAALVNATFATPGVRLTFGKSNPQIAYVIPEMGDIYQIGSNSFPTEDQPMVYIWREAGMPTITLQYQIYGPGQPGDPGSSTVYLARDPGTNNVNVDPGNIVNKADGFYGQGFDGKLDSARYMFQGNNNTGKICGTGGIIDLSTNEQDIVPGQYYAEASMDIKGIGTVKYPTQRFNLSLTNDLALFIWSPKRKEDKKYPLGTLPIQLEVYNFGIDDIEEFDLYAVIYKDGQRVSDTLHTHWKTTAGPPAILPLTAGKSMIVNMYPSFYPPSTGTFEIKGWAVLGSMLTDQDPSSNIVPRAGAAAYEFSIAKEVDLKAVSIVNPNASNPVTVGRPMHPISRFTNQGVNDLDFDSVFFEIKYNPTGAVVFRDTVVNAVLSAGARYDTTNVTANKTFVAQFTGEYQICSRVVSTYDNNPASQKIVCTNFTAIGGLAGDYTVGTGGYFATIQEAVNMLYMKGASGHVRFILTDRNYTIGDTLRDDAPALDLSAHISGMGPNATVTFKPSDARAVERGGNNSGVTIKVLTGSGYGILFGQNIQPANGSAIVLTAAPSNVNKYSNSAGYFNIDGGQNKSFRFVLVTRRTVNQHFHNVIYMRQGSVNNQIKNCIFENDYKNSSGVALTPHVYLPHLSSSGTDIEYMPDDLNLTTTGYSSAIVMRAIAPYDLFGANRQYNLDTLTIKNNVISGNEISGFGYGIVDMGSGALLRLGHNVWTKYYNNNNVISDNTIKSVSRAGIFLGYTENEKVTGNRIYNVTGLGANTYTPMGYPVFYDAGGILAGGDQLDGYYGFNNMGLTISGNEISNVTSEYLAYGIKVEQQQTEFQHTPVYATFPDGNENTKVMNNIVWGVNTPYDANRAGIRIFTQRASMDPSDFLNAMIPDYFTTGDLVLSNTVIMPDDEGKTEGGLVGIAVQHSKNTKILNNAVAMLDNYVDVANAPAAAAIFYEGILPAYANGLESNRNAFWQPSAYLPHEGPSAYGFVELNEDGDFIEPITAGDYDLLGYETLRQWRNWTGQDYNSVIGDFTQDMEYTGTTVQYLRVKTPKPFGSILNDRGFRLNEYLNGTVYNYDAFNTQRGTNGQMYDLGAEEFEGRMYLSDVEFQMISSPAAYKSGTGAFADAEHIMTTLPLDLKVILRNSGNIFQAATKVRLEVICDDAGIHYYDTLETDIVVAQSKEITFPIPSSIMKTYSDLIASGMNPVIPAKYNASMIPNVTPIYTFNVEVQADENNWNNNGSAIMRFYIRESNVKLMLISAEYANTDIYNTTSSARTVDEIAGRLNYEYLKTAFEKMKYWPGINRDIDHPGETMDTFKVDVFDRTAWEPKSVDYRMYKYVFWSDRNDSNGLNTAMNTINRNQQWDLAEFLEAGTTNNKRNLVIASQEAIRNIYYEGDEKSIMFVNQYLRAIQQGNGYPFGTTTNCNDRQIKGVALGKDFVQLVKQTGLDFDYTPATTVVDMFPKVGSCGLFKLGEGLAKESYLYPEPNPDLGAGTAVTTLTKNVVYIGVDWRHMGNPEAILRSIMDFYDKNGGTEIPIELSDFDAKSTTNRVDITWATESELNSDRFEVERAELSDGIKSDFSRIAVKSAAGKSSVRLEYGPIVDRDVEFGDVYIYRLKMLDKDGRYEYSDERMVEVGGEGLWISEARPNPVQGVAKFDIRTGGKNVEMFVYDVNGRSIEVKYEISNGVMEMDMSAVNSGVYTIVLKSGDFMLTRQLRVVK